MGFVTLFTITVPGQPYLLDQLAGVGSNILFNYAAPTNTPDGLAASSVDKQRSGKFLIYKARYKFNNGMCDATMDIVKLTESIKE